MPIPPSIPETRRRSASLFGNEKVAEVIVAVQAAGGPCTAQEISLSTGVGHSMVRDALRRLVESGLVVTLPKVGGARSAQYYTPAEQEAWRLVVSLAGWLGAQEPSRMI